MSLATQEGILDRIQVTEQQLGELLFCNDPRHFVAMALIEKKLVGIIFYSFTHHNACFNTSKGIYVEHLYVDPEFRSQGIGRTLLDYVINEAKINFCSQIEWWVSLKNTSASQFYKYLGARSLDQFVYINSIKRVLIN